MSVSSMATILRDKPSATEMRVDKLLVILFFQERYRVIFSTIPLDGASEKCSKAYVFPSFC